MYALSTWPIPAGSGPLYASGTTASCTVQGFFIQLSLAAPMYNLFLAAHYLLVIKYGWSAVELNAAEKRVHPLIMTIAFGIAIAGIPLKIFNNANVWCWIAPNPNDPDRGNNGKFVFRCRMLQTFIPQLKSQLLYFVDMRFSKFLSVGVLLRGIMVHHHYCDHHHVSCRGFSEEAGEENRKILCSEFRLRAKARIIKDCSQTILLLCSCLLHHVSTQLDASDAMLWWEIRGGSPATYQVGISDHTAHSADHQKAGPVRYIPLRRDFHSVTRLLQLPHLPAAKVLALAEEAQRS